MSDLSGDRAVAPQVGMKPGLDRCGPVRAVAPIRPAVPDAIALEAIGLDQLVQRHAAAFGRVRAAGDWSDHEFRRWVGPLLLAFTRHVHLLPTGRGQPPGSLLAEGLRRAADALLQPTVCASPGSDLDPHDRRRIVRQQITTVAGELAPLLGIALAGWRVAIRGDTPVDPFDRALADLLADLPADLPANPRQAQQLAAGAGPVVANAYRVWPVDPVALGGDASTVQASSTDCLGMALLLRSVPPGLARLLALSGASLRARDADCRGAMPDGAGSIHAGTLARVPDATHLRSAMHALIAGGRWVVNRRRARLWHLDGALYLVWKTAAGELEAWFAERRSASSESMQPLLVDADSLLEAMQLAGLLVPGNGLLKSIRTPFTEALQVVELADPAGWMRALSACPGNTVQGGSSSTR